MRLFLALVLFVSGHAVAASSNVFACSGGLAGLPVNLVWKQADCAAAGTGGRPVLPGMTNGLYCTGASSSLVVGAQWPAGAVLTCTTNILDTTTGVGNGNIFLNCVDCPRTNPAGAVQNLGNVIMGNAAGSANGGCFATTFAGVAAWICNSALMMRCNLNGFFYSCSLSHKREPDVTTLENYVVMAVLSIIFLAAFAFGWKIGHGSTTQ